MGKRHLVLSDIHENSGSLQRILAEARKTNGGYDDIWLLGDLLGHADRISGRDAFNSDVPAVIALIENETSEAVFGNWEYWLTHPEDDRVNPAQEKYLDQLQGLRAGLNGTLDRVLEKLSMKAMLTVTKETPEFTLFHGCSFRLYSGDGHTAAPWESYLYPKELNRVTRGLFENSANLTTDHFLFGHTHMPGYFVYSMRTLTNVWMQFTENWLGVVFPYRNGVQRFGINPGSVGERRTGLPRTALIIDQERATFEYVADPKSLCGGGNGARAFGGI